MGGGGGVPPCCPQTRSPRQAANFMQLSSCLWSWGRDRYYHQDGAEKRRKLSGNALRWIKASGTYRHGSVFFFFCLRPLLSFILQFSLLSASLLTCWEVGRLWCAAVMLPDQLTWMCVLFHREHPENASTSGQCLPTTPFVFPSNTFFCTSTKLLNWYQKSIFYLDLDDDIFTFRTLNAILCCLNQRKHVISPSCCFYFSLSDLSERTASVPTSWRCSAGFRNGNEESSGTVSKSSRLNISLNGWANVCFFSFFFKFKLAQKFGSRASSAARTLPWTPALLTPTWCVHVSGCYCVNYLKYGAAFILCASCAELGVCACESGEPEKDLTSFSGALPAFPPQSFSLLAKQWISTWQRSGLLCLTLDTIIYGVCGCRLCLT